MALEELRQAIEGKVLKADRVSLHQVLPLGMQKPCMDGRSDLSSGVFIPGGNMGFLYDLVASIGDMRGEELSMPQIRQIVGAAAQTSGGIYYHTDQHHFDGLRANLLQHPGLALHHADIETDLNGFLNNGGKLDPMSQAIVLEELAKEVGCGHVGGIMDHPSRYGIDPGTARNVHDAFWMNRWDQGQGGEVDSYRHPVLQGNHGEKAIVFIWGETAGEVGEGLEPDDQVLVLTPSEEPSIFLLSPPSADAYRRSAIAALQTEGILGEFIRPNQVAELQHQMARRFDDGLVISAGLLKITHLPVFDVTNSRRSKPVVTLRK